jgi:hypothetical protein
LRRKRAKRAIIVSHRAPTSRACRQDSSRRKERLPYREIGSGSV